MAVIFRENFEAGDQGAFDSTVTSGGGAVTYDSNSKVSGTYTLKSAFSASGNAYVLEDFGSDYETLYIQTTVHLDSGWSFGTASYFTIFRVVDSSNNLLVALNVENWGSLRLTLYGTALGWKDTGEVLSVNATTKIEVKLIMKASGGNVKLWLNNDTEGSPDYDTGSVNTGDSDIRKLHLGTSNTDGTVSPVYYDDVIISTSFIGTIVENSERGLYLQGKTAGNSTRGLYLQGSISSNSERGLYLEGGDFVWKGYTWDVRDGGTGGPGFGGWSENNVSVDGDGYLNLKITNPTGDSPIGSQIVSQTTGLGYGTYTITVGTRLDNIDKNIVFGGLFPFYYGNPYIELDVNETSKWDTESSVISHTVWYGSNPESPSNLSKSSATPSDVVQTHRLIWEEGRATFDSFIGSNTAGIPYFHTQINENVPEPSTEALVINLWAYAEGNPTADDIDIPETTVIVRDISYSPHIPTTLSTVVGSADDGQINNAASPVFNNTFNYITAGRISGNYYSAYCRFDDLRIPNGATIVSARAIFQSTANRTGNNANFNLHFCAEDDAVSPTDVDTFNNKSLTTGVAWNTVEGWEINANYATPDLKVALQEVINRSGWDSGQAVCLMINNNNSTSGAYRQAKSHDGYPDNTAILEVEYYLPERGVYIQGKDTSNSTRELYIQGKISGDSERSIYTSGYDTATSERAIYTSGVDESESERGLYLQGKSTGSSDRGLYLEGRSASQEGNSERNLWITGKDIDTSERGLHISGVDTSSSERNLFIQGVEGADSERSLHIEGSISADSERNLYLSGIATANSTRNLYLAGIDTGTSERDLYTQGTLDSDSERGLYLQGKGSANSERGLHLEGSISTESERNLYASGVATSDSNRSLYIQGTLDTFGERGLYLECIPVSSERGLWLEGREWSEKKLWIEGAGGDYSERGLWINGIDTGNSEISLYLIGSLDDSLERGLHLSGIGTDESERGLHTSGVDIGFSERNVWVFGKDSNSSVRGLYLIGKQSTESEVGLYIEGTAVVSERSIYIAGEDSGYSFRELRIEGIDTSYSERSLLLQGKDTGYSERSLYIEGAELNHSERGLYLSGIDTGNSQRGLLITGKSTDSDTRALWIEGKGTGFGERGLFIRGSTVGSSERGLFTEGSGNYGERNLHIRGKDTGSSLRGLYLKGKLSDSSHRSLYLEGIATGDSIRGVWMKGIGHGVKKVFMTGRAKGIVVVGRVVDKGIQVETKVKSVSGREKPKHVEVVNKKINSEVKVR